MEEYANWEFHFMWDKMCDDPNYFYKETALLEIFMSFWTKTPIGLWTTSLDYRTNLAPQFPL